MIRGQIERGCPVLVTCGTSALGQACISVCLSLGCQVYAVVSDEGKKEFLLKVFPELEGNKVTIFIDIFYFV